MNVFQNYNKAKTLASRLELTGASLSVGLGPVEADNTATFDLNDIVARFSEDHGCVALATNGMFNSLSWFETTRISNMYRMPANKAFASDFALGEAVKSDSESEGRYNVASPAWVLKENGMYPLLFILTPFSGCTLSDCTLIWKAIEGQPEMARFIVDGQDQENAAVIASIKQHMAEWLPITLAGPDTVAADGTAQYMISAEVPSNIYISASSGILNRSIAKNGQTLLIDARGLAAGEQIEIKLGYKWWPGASKKVVTVQ
jgi:hypothetical protein